MAFTMRLDKANNFFKQDFENAYWRLENINIGNYDGETIINFQLKAYSNRESVLTYKTEPAKARADFRGPTNIYEIPALYHWLGSFPAATIFPDGIPTSEAEQKNILYPFVKSFLRLKDFTDVYEVGQDGYQEEEVETEEPPNFPEKP